LEPDIREISPEHLPELSVTRRKKNIMIVTIAVTVAAMTTQRNNAMEVRSEEEYGLVL